MSSSTSGGAYDLASSVDRRETAVTARLERDADRCYALFCEIEAIPRWLDVVSAVDVQARDERGRVTQATFVGELAGGSLRYTLQYTYDDAVRRLRWQGTDDDSGVVLRGSATFSAHARGGCLMRYALCAALEDEAQWSDPLFQARPAEAVVVSFCEWVSSRGAARPDEDEDLDDGDLDDISALDDLGD